MGQLKELSRHKPILKELSRISKKKENSLRITLKEKGKKSKKGSFVFPALPEQISMKSNTRYQSYDIINKGPVQIPKGTDTDTISWTGVFYGAKLKDLQGQKNWIKPRECEKILINWMTRGTVLNLIVSKTGINYDVTISSFERTQTGAFGNIEYSISFSTYRPLKVYDASELKLKPYEVKERPTPPPANTYTVAAGDSLWKIAADFYDSGVRWPEIYAANQAAIEETANKYRNGRGSDNGHWIYPGQVLTIP